MQLPHAVSGRRRWPPPGGRVASSPATELPQEQAVRMPSVNHGVCVVQEVRLWQCRLRARCGPPFPPRPPPHPHPHPGCLRGRIALSGTAPASRARSAASASGRLQQFWRAYTATWLTRTLPSPFRSAMPPCRLCVSRYRGKISKLAPRQAHFIEHQCSFPFDNPRDALRRPDLTRTVRCAASAPPSCPWPLVCPHA